MFLAVVILKGKTSDFVAYAVICIYLLLPPDKFEVVYVWQAAYRK